MPFKPKIDESGNIVLKDGMAVMADSEDAEKEIFFASPEKVADLNRESAERRHKIKDLEKSFAAFKDIDPAKHKELLAFREQHKDSDEQIKAVRAENEASYAEKLLEKDVVVSARDGIIRKLTVTNGFAASKWILDHTILPPDVAESHFGNYFEVNDEGLAVAKIDGKELFSRKKPGEMADFEEAIEIIVNSYPNKDAIMRDPSQSGSGAPGNTTRSSGVQNPWKKETKNLTEQSRIASENPLLAKKLKAEAGIAW